jgi:hypothetical protein
VGSEGSVEQRHEPMNENRIRGARQRTSDPTIVKSISIKAAQRRSGGCVRKAVILTSGGLHCVRKRTEGIERDPERDAEVSRGQSSQEQSGHSTGTLT